ncbi:MAG: ABC transporter permease [Deltaproteobacteria bacterium]|nr:ABC transporter permease [Deltaproteobacteria bacterium]
MLKRLKNMLVKEFLQMFRDVRMRVMIFVVPVIQMTVLAFALTMDVTQIRTAVLDLDNTPASRELLAEFTSAGYFRVVTVARSQDDLRRILDRDQARVALHIPAGFEKDLQGGRTATVQILADGTDSNTTSILLGYANRIAAGFNARKIEERARILLGSGRVPPDVDIRMRAWFNPNLESRLYYVPALIAVMLLVVSMLLTSIAIVREKEIGTIEQMLVTPITRLEFILGKTLPYLITGYIILTMMVLIAMGLFDLSVKGNWLLLYLMTGVYLAGNIGLALLISVSAGTQQQALLTAFLIVMPFVLLSGFIFPVRNMPLPVQYATFLDPMRWYLEILRGVVLKGVGLRALWPSLMGQTALAVLFITLASLRFKKTLA